MKALSTEGTSFLIFIFQLYQAIKSLPDHQVGWDLHAHKKKKIKVNFFRTVLGSVKMIAAVLGNVVSALDSLGKLSMFQIYLFISMVSPFYNNNTLI